MTNSAKFSIRMFSLFEITDFHKIYSLYRVNKTALNGQFFSVSHFRINGFLARRSVTIYHLHTGFTVFIKDNINYKDNRMNLISINIKICIPFLELIY